MGNEKELGKQEARKMLLGFIERVIASAKENHDRSVRMAGYLNGADSFLAFEKSYLEELDRIKSDIDYLLYYIGVSISEG